MERKYSQLPFSQLEQERASLKHRLDSAQSVLAGISQPDWVTNQKRARTPSNLRWGGRLDLSGLTPEEYFQRLSQTIIPIQLKLQRDIIPTYGERLKEISDELRKRAPESSQTLALSTDNQTTTANLVISLVPENVVRFWSASEGISPGQYQTQVLTFASFIQDVKEGKVQPVNPLEILVAPDDQKEEKATSVLRHSLAELMLMFPQRLPESLQMRWGRKIRELMDFLGSNAQQHVVNVINSLPDVERALVLQTSSIKLLEDLDYVDLEECDEKRFATYLRNAAFDPQGQRDENFENLITTAIERSDAGTLNLTAIIELLSEPPYDQFIFERLMESAHLADLDFHLIEFFSSHPNTSRFAREIQESEDYDPVQRRKPTNLW